MKRRDAVRLLGAAALSPQAEAWARHDTALKGSAARGAPRGAAGVRQPVCRCPYRQIPLPELCRAALDIGLGGIDLLARDEWDQVRQCGLVCSMAYAVNRRDFIATGFNDRANHAMLLRELEEALPLAARHGVPNIIAMFGNRRGKSDAEAIDNCVAGLNQIKGVAEAQGVTVCLELLNSKVDHADYQGDRTAFGVAVVKAVGSPRVRLLYDIYHMQIMEGDIIRTIRDNREWIAHFHTGGGPGRHGLDGPAERNWGAVASAIADTGFAGFVAHEVTPTAGSPPYLREAGAVGHGLQSRRSRDTTA